MSGRIVGVSLVPHPPIMVKEVAKDEYEKVKQTALAMEEWAEGLKVLGPDAVIIISPHAPVFQDAIIINDNDILRGDLEKFGVPEISIEMPFARALAQKIAMEATKASLFTTLLDEKSLKKYKLSSRLDHGVVAPLSFYKGNIPPAVVMSMAFYPSIDLYSFGISLRKAVQDYGKRVAIIISGDMSHKITSSAPAGYHADGVVFDKMVLEALKQANFKALFDIPEEIRENAGECGFRSLLMGLGSLDGLQVDAKVLSYEAPFGVGYLVANFTPLQVDTSRAILNDLKMQREFKISESRSKESFPVQLARRTVEQYILNEESPARNRMDIGITGKAGVFVSIKKEGQLRGCIGTTLPTTGSISQEIISNAVNAAVNDPRFYPITDDELPYLTYSVDILTEAEPISNRDELDAKKYGVIVRNGGKSGLLLPDLEGVDSVDEQINIALKKAGIREDEEYKISKFEVIRYK